MQKQTNKKNQRSENIREPEIKKTTQQPRENADRDRSNVKKAAR
jgi:hypothetical protein